ncbi:MAG: hypothetical protein IH975_09855 [Nitrospinae bacterium]|nr:hypothetical protein [Nitrospinota bacterium]
MKAQGDSLKEREMRKEDLRNRGLVGLLKEVEYDSISLNSAIEIALLDARTERQLVAVLKDSVADLIEEMEEELEEARRFQERALKVKIRRASRQRASVEDVA